MAYNPFPKVAIYTCIVGGYDDLKEQPEFPYPNVDLICFTDTLDQKTTGKWQLRKLASPPNLNMRLISKYHKMFPHDFLSDYDATIYIDGSVVIKDINFVQVMLNYLRDADLVLFKHPERMTIREEVEFCQNIPRFQDIISVLNKQLEYYENQGFANQRPLVASGVMARKTENAKVAAMGEEWFEHNKNWTTRGQISLPFVAWKHGIKLCIIDEIIWDNKYLRVEHHNYQN